MIISASRRTDIPALYSDWFFNRISAGFVYARNPMTARQVSRIPLNPEVVDGIVFWTKNPGPVIERLEELRDYPYYFQFTITPYGQDIEKNLPDKDRIVSIFCELSSRIGKERVVWRYDPILISEKYSLDYHRRAFDRLCDRLAPYTEKCTVSFLDVYRGMSSRISPLNIRPPSQEETEALAEHFGRRAREHGIYVDTCAESIDHEKYGISNGACIDIARFERIGNCRLDVPPDKNQRPKCGCAKSIDIGAYDTCKNGCVYCYADHNRAPAGAHDTESPLIWGELDPEDCVKPAEAKSAKQLQNRLSFE